MGKTLSICTSHLSLEWKDSRRKKTSRQASPSLGSRNTARAVSAERMLYVTAVIKTFANILITTVLPGFSFFFFLLGFCFFHLFQFGLYPSDRVGHGCSKIISLVFTGFKDTLLTDNGEEAWT